MAQCKNCNSYNVRCISKAETTIRDKTGHGIMLTASVLVAFIPELTKGASGEASRRERELQKTAKSKYHCNNCGHEWSEIEWE